MRADHQPHKHAVAHTLVDSTGGLAMSLRPRHTLGADAPAAVNAPSRAPGSRLHFVLTKSHQRSTPVNPPESAEPVDMNAGMGGDIYGNSGYMPQPERTVLVIKGVSFGLRQQAGGCVRGGPQADRQPAPQGLAR